jgi:hypothetical protein
MIDEERSYFMKRTYTAATRQESDTHGLNRSPMRAAFQGSPTAPRLNWSKKLFFVELFVVAARIKADVQISSRMTTSSAGKSKSADIRSILRRKRIGKIV